MSVKLATVWFIVGLTVSTFACRPTAEADAYGNVEAVEVSVGSEIAGRIETFDVVEGAQLAAGAIVGTIETTSEALEGESVLARRSAQEARIDEVEARLGSLEAQRAIAVRSLERTRRLHEAEAATSQQLDQSEKEVRQMEEQIRVGRAQIQTIRQELVSFDVQRAQVAERISKGSITNPVSGTVLAVYAHAGEQAQAGRPLYRIADLDRMEVRAWIAETQLATVKTGQHVVVTVDSGRDRISRRGRVTWIASEAEFTPTPIQTRDERADLVYAIRILVDNPDRALKIGMPAEVDLDVADADDV